MLHILVYEIGVFGDCLAAAVHQHFSGYEHIDQVPSQDGGLPEHDFVEDQVGEEVESKGKEQDGHLGQSDHVARQQLSERLFDRAVSQQIVFVDEIKPDEADARDEGQVRQRIALEQGQPERLDGVGIFSAQAVLNLFHQLVSLLLSHVRNGIVVVLQLFLSEAFFAFAGEVDHFK